MKKFYLALFAIIFALCACGSCEPVATDADVQADVTLDASPDVVLDAEVSLPDAELDAKTPVLDATVDADSTPDAR